MPNTKTITSFLALAAGATLIATAKLLANAVPHEYTKVAYGYGFLAWWFLAAGATAWGFQQQLPKPWLNRFLLVLAVFLLSFFPRYLKDYQLLTVQTAATAGTVLLFYGLLTCRPLHARLAQLDSLLHRVAMLPTRHFALFMFALFLSITVGLCWYCFSFIPAFDDSVPQYAQAKIMAKGMLYGHSHPLQKFFGTPMTMNDGKRWYAQYSPGYMALLALGFLIHAPWLVNPLIGACTLLALYTLARHISDEPTAKLTAILMCGSPFMLIMSSEYMNHPTALLGGTLFVLCYTQTLETLPKNRASTYRWAIGAGLSLGAVFLARPLSAVGIGLPYALYALTLMRRQMRAYTVPFLLITSAAMLCVLIQLWYDQQVTGNMWILPSGRYHGGNIAAMGYDGSNSLRNSLLKAEEEWRQLNQRLFEWFVPSTLFVAIACLRPLANRHQNLLLAMVFSYTAVNMANQFHSSIFGPRYMYENSAALCFFSAIGIRSIPALLAKARFILPGSTVIRGAVAIIVGACFIPAVMVGLPDNLHGYSNHYFHNHPDFYAKITAQATAPALIFIEPPNPAADSMHPSPNKYEWFSYTNPPDDNDDFIFARDLGGPEDAKLIELYPHRTAYVERDGKLYPF